MIEYSLGIQKTIGSSRYKFIKQCSSGLRMKQDGKSEYNFLMMQMIKSARLLKKKKQYLGN